jgi:xanthine dehydrogenase small subunit
MSTLRFHLNDRLIEDADVPPTTTLLNYLRQRARLTGTKEGCAEGDCGACTVIVLDAEADPAAPRFRAVNSCLMFVPMVQGRRVYTVEGLAQRGQLHPAQAALVEQLGSQCGYCTPGVVMAAFEACYREDLREPWQLDDQMCGNLCRCTGYRPIREAVRMVAGTCPKDVFATRRAEAQPADLEFARASEGRCYVQPTSLEALWRAIAERPQARLVCGGTDLALLATQRYQDLPELIGLEGVPELRGVSRASDGWFEIGATTTLTDLEAACLGPLRSLSPLLRILRYFASRQIKHRATVGGNLCNASPIGDLAPALLALGAEVVLRSAAGARTLPLDQFFLAYRKTALAPGEVLAAVRVPEPPEAARMAAYKVSKRRELDISAVAAGLYVETSAEGLVTEVRAAFGGMAATPARARGLEAALRGQPWTEATVEAALPALARDFSPLSDHRGSAWFRGHVAENLVRGFFHETAATPRPELPPRPTGTVHLEVMR